MPRARAKCYECQDLPWTVVRDGKKICDECDAWWGKPVEIHEPTIERVRRDVEDYHSQAAWLDTCSLLRMFDQVRKDLAREHPIADSARAVAAKWADMRESYASTEEQRELAELLDALGNAVKEGDR